MFDGVFVLFFPKETTVVGLADDLTLVLVAKNPENVKVYETANTVKYDWKRSGRSGGRKEKSHEGAQDQHSV